MIDLLKDGPVNISVTLSKMNISIVFSGSLVGKADVNSEGLLTDFVSFRDEYRYIISSIVNTLRANLGPFVGKDLYLYLNEEDFLCVSEGDIDYNSALKKAKFINAEHITGTDNSLMDLLIFLKFIDA